MTTEIKPGMLVTDTPDTPHAPGIWVVEARMPDDGNWLLAPYDEEARDHLMSRAMEPVYRGDWYLLPLPAHRRLTLACVAGRPRK